MSVKLTNHILSRSTTRSPEAQLDPELRDLFLNWKLLIMMKSLLRLNQNQNINIKSSELQVVSNCDIAVLGI